MTVLLPDFLSFFRSFFLGGEHPHFWFKMSTLHHCIWTDYDQNLLLVCYWSEGLKLDSYYNYWLLFGSDRCHSAAKLKQDIADDNRVLCHGELKISWTGLKYWSSAALRVAFIYYNNKFCSDPAVTGPKFYRIISFSCQIYWSTDNRQ